MFGNCLRASSTCKFYGRVMAIQSVTEILSSKKSKMAKKIKTVYE